MTGRVSTVTRKGQITIPIEIRRALGIEEGDKVVFSLAGDKAQLERVPSVTQRTAGIFRSYGKPMSAEDERRMTEEAIARDVIRRMGDE